MSESEIEEAVWLTESLLAGLRDGFRYDVWQCESPYDRLSHITQQTFAHELDQNDLNMTSLGERAKIFNLHYESEGQDWLKATSAMVAVLGPNKQSTVVRWRVIAKDFSPDILNHIRAHRDIPQKYVVGNKFLVGKGADGRFKLSNTWGKVAFDWCIAHRVQGLSPSSDAFQEEYCHVAKHGETWERAQKKVFGVTATGFKAFERIVAKLKTEAGRKAILAWLREPALRKQPNFGLEDASAVVAEMKRMLAGTNPSEETAAGTAATEDGSQEGAGQTAPGAAADSKPLQENSDSDGDFMMSTKGRDAEPDDPIAAKAMDLAEGEMLHVSMHSGEAHWATEIESNVFPTSKPIIYIECPTSRPTTFVAFLKLAPHFPKSYSLYIPLGCRFDLGPTLVSLVARHLGGRKAYVIMISTGSQSLRIKPSFALYSPMDSKEEIPTHVSLKGCRATSVEGIRLRCLDKGCLLRPEKPQKSKPDDAQEEFEPEDQDGGLDFEETFEAGEDSDEEDKDAEQVENAMKDAAGPPPEPSDPYVVNLFCYASPVACHNRINSDVLKANQRTHLLLLTRTAHPGVIIAARQAHLKVIGLRLGVSPHAVAHGQLLMKKMFAHNKLKEARALLAQSAALKRLRVSELQFIPVAAPPATDQALRVTSVENQPASVWRAGLNGMPSGLEDKIVKQLQVELETSGLLLKRVGTSEHVVSGRAYREGDVVCSMGGPTFDCMEKLKEFLNAGDVNKSLSAVMCRVSGVVVNQEDPAQIGCLYRVFTGRIVNTTLTHKSWQARLGEAGKQRCNNLIKNRQQPMNNTSRTHSSAANGGSNASVAQL